MEKNKQLKEIAQAFADLSEASFSIGAEIPEEGKIKTYYHLNGEGSILANAIYEAMKSSEDLAKVINYAVEVYNEEGL